MTRFKTKVTEGGRVVLPAQVRRELGIDVGDELVVLVEGSSLRLLSYEESLREAQELVARYAPARGRSVVDEFLAERRAEAEAE
jgi:AbrB family looped-hinge helix DNA binding protein